MKTAPHASRTEISVRLACYFYRITLCHGINLTHRPLDAIKTCRERFADAAIFSGSTLLDVALKFHQLSIATIPKCVIRTIGNSGINVVLGIHQDRLQVYKLGFWVSPIIPL